MNDDLKNQFGWNALRTLQHEAWQTSEDSGFHAPKIHPGETEPRKASLVERLMLTVSELSEALEHYRDGKISEIFYDDSQSINGHAPKPDGLPIEMADAFIRILDLCEEAEIDLAEATRIKMDYNKTREPMHGRKM